MVVDPVRDSQRGERRGRRRYWRSTKRQQVFMRALGWSAMVLGSCLAGIGLFRGHLQLLRWAVVYLVGGGIMLAGWRLLAARDRARKRKCRAGRTQNIKLTTGA